MYVVAHFAIGAYDGIRQLHVAREYPTSMSRGRIFVFLQEGAQTGRDFRAVFGGCAGNSYQNSNKHDQPVQLPHSAIEMILPEGLAVIIIRLPRENFSYSRINENI